ncbi:cytochrome c biogenesis protein CcdA [Adhaeribacter pallidiroseus]|uniref:Protein-disulfide reductase n=1 Tax=Adhaeribacter pallidiroseus TaxID=2072847 RepID=A0A369QSQ0_9BACT|nr:cytochrome c biogenesis protein CcdA [Adhaeribacter pallidiroseus]RDC65849.1 Protein-disulfide reductase [Adhaeribacter pallidiroseus]
MTKILKKCRYFLFFFFLLLSGTAWAQILKPATWAYATSKKEAKVNEQLELVFDVKIDKDWYLYSTDFDPDLGPMVTTFTFQPNSSYELVGKLKPIHPKKKHSALWGGEYTYFVHTAQFRQVVKVLNKDFKVTGHVEYQVCTEVDGKCIPFDQDFAFSDLAILNSTAGHETNATIKKTAASKATAPAVTSKIAETAEEKAPAPSQAKAAPVVKDLSSPDKNLAEEKSVLPKTGKEISKISPSKVSLVAPGTASGSLLSFMLLAFLAGVAALITPCVFPMIPMTVTFFTTNSNDRQHAIVKALIYGFSIIAIYTLVGTIVSRLNGPEFANWLSTHWLPNLLFFAIFIFFGLSFLGLFEIVLPSSLVNKMDKQADKGGYYGVVFMAFTIVLVSFSCTGPIVGSILVESAGELL